MHTAAAKSRLLTWSADDALALAHLGDPLRVRQLVSNLLSNAVKFTDVDGIEVIVLAPHGSTEAQLVEIAVSDTGIGIEPEQAEAASRRVHADWRLELSPVPRYRARPGQPQATPG